MAKVARSVGRLDFWNVYAGMTSYEIAVTQALWQLEPWGDDRADLRHAVNTVAAAGTSQSDTDEALNNLENYLPVKSADAKREISPTDAAKRFGG